MYYYTLQYRAVTHTGDKIIIVVALVIAGSELLTLLGIYFGGDPVRRTLFSAEIYLGVFRQNSGLFASAVAVGLGDYISNAKFEQN